MNISMKTKREECEVRRSWVLLRISLVQKNNLLRFINVLFAPNTRI